MNIKLISKALHTLSLLSDEDVAIVIGLRSASEDERSVLMLALEPNTKPSQKKSSKKGVGVKAATTREYDHCLRCGTTKRDPSHKDTSSPDYHEFQSSKDDALSQPKKSARASSLQRAIKGTIGGGIVLCGASLASPSADCGLPEGHALHSDKGYVDYHPFRPATSASTATTQSPANGGGESSGVNFETQPDVAGVAVSGD